MFIGAGTESVEGGPAASGRCVGEVVDKIHVVTIQEAPQEKGFNFP